MNDYMFLMHDDATAAVNREAWGPYLAMLTATGRFQGGSSMGGGLCVNKAGREVPLAGHLTGFLRVEAESTERARELLVGNPVFEAGGTVEIRELPKD